MSGNIITQILKGQGMLTTVLAHEIRFKQLNLYLVVRITARGELQKEQYDIVGPSICLDTPPVRGKQFFSLLLPHKIGMR